MEVLPEPLESPSGKAHTTYRIDTKLLIVAEGEGFEPPVELPLQRFSRPPPSTARPSLRVEFAPDRGPRAPGRTRERAEDDQATGSR